MDIIEILVLMVCVGVLLYRKSVQKPSGKSRKASKSRPLHSDSFPSAERAVPHASVSPEMPMKDFTTLHASASKRKTTASSVSKQDEPSAAEPVAGSNVKENIRFRSKEDVCRAFLYSEIFNRKYN